MEFQAQLFADLRHIHGYRWKCRGAAKRLRQGKPVPDDAPDLAPGMDRSDAAAWEQTLQAQWLAMAAGTRDLAPGESLLRVFNRQRTMTINRSVLNRLLIELIELPTWSRAIREVLTAPGAHRSPEIVFAQEANIWK
jgi:hypothetical protein